MPQSPLCIITPNPALDRILIAPELRLGAVQRVSETRVAAGGKGLNVARAAQAIGSQAVVCAPLGGLTGQQVAWLATQEGLPIHAVAIAGETRVCTLIVDPAGETVTVLNEIGPELSTGDWHALTERVLATAAGLNLICGSLPPGLPPDALFNLVQALHAKGRHALVDTSGPALAAAVAAKPAVVKVNGEELGALLGQRITSVVAAQQAVAELYHYGIKVVVVTLGAQGAVGISVEGGVIAIPPQIAVRNPIGCGDSFFAGLASALSNGQSLAEALRFATACAVADAQTLAPGQIDDATVNRLTKHVSISYW